MKKLLLMTSLLSLCLITRSPAQDEPAEEDSKEGKVQYTLIMPEEKTPELVKPNELSPFGGLVDDKTRDTASGEETRVGDLLRSLPVVGKSSRNCVLLGDIILRKGQIVPPVVPNQVVQLLVRDISPDQIELVWVEKKPTGLNPRVLTIQTDVTPQVMQQLPGKHAGGGSKGQGGPPVMGVFGSWAKSAPAAGKPAPRAEPVQDQPPAEAAPAASRSASAGSALLNLFFGNQVKEPAKAGAAKTVEEGETKASHVEKP